MFFLSKPSRSEIRGFLNGAAAQNFSYKDVGATATLLHPRGYTADRNRKLLGYGATIFDRAVGAIASWQMFNFDWIELTHDSPPQPGAIVCVNASHFGFHSLNACKVIYVVDERQGAGGTEACAGSGTTTFGFAYGTLEDHCESGEERFCVVWDSADDAVYYDLFAFSRPGKVIVWLGYPIARCWQHRFVKCSQSAMLRAVGS